MKRNAVNNLITWKENGTKVPFLLVGTKGTGKTYLAIEFALAYYPQYLYVNFELNMAARSFFEQHLTDDSLLTEVLAAYFEIDERYLSELVVILDEISYCPVLLQKLEEVSNSPIIAISGQLPGNNREQTGKLQICRLYP